MPAMKGRQGKALALLSSSGREKRKLEPQRDWSENETGKVPRPCDLTQRQPIDRESIRPTILVSRIAFSAVYSVPSMLPLS